MRWSWRGMSRWRRQGGEVESWEWSRVRVVGKRRRDWGRELCNQGWGSWGFAIIGLSAAAQPSHNITAISRLVSCPSSTTEPNSLSLFSLQHHLSLSLDFSLNLRLFLPMSVMIQCETNGRGDANVVLKKKIKKGVLEGTKTGTLTRESNWKKIKDASGIK
jgi:hypothetical protein